jgi:hypothetical protein
MSQLDPELRRLIHWSRAADEEQLGDAPFGAAGRIASRWRDVAMQAEPAWWGRLQLATAWMSVAIMILGGTVWISRVNSSAGAYDFAPAYQVIAQNIAP